ncbi:ALKBH6 [Bugula neritina]|nr:ALKBH6 [Bugula neritina]
MDRITESTGAFTATTQPNHCLVNEYRPGQGIMPHEDGNMFYPTVSTITLGSHTVLDFYKHINDEDCDTLSVEDRHIGSVLLERRSLVLVQDSMYKTHLHGIKEVACDTLSQSIANLDHTEHSLGDQLPRDTRVSLTIRHVNKTTNISKSISLFGKHKK